MDKILILPLSLEALFLTGGAMISITSPEAVSGLIETSRMGRSLALIIPMMPYSRGGVDSISN